jgi:lysozyme family protein
MNFDQAFEHVIGNEGGYVNDPRDPGGETKYGISKRSYPGEDIAGLTLARAKELYRRDFWGPAGCEQWPEAVRFDVFDMAVNAGVKASIKMLQRCVGADDDGVIGRQTIAAVQNFDTQPEVLARKFTAQRIRHYTSLKTWPVFGAGWMNRIAANLERA